jgi:cyclopropane fatty-acyl-phospholipid synthase-like methyltransferase
MLDVGCGDGTFLRFLELSGYQAIEGIEISESQAADARKRLKCPVHVANPETWLASHRSYYTRIFVNDVLEHIEREEVVPFLQTLATGLATGGALVMSVPQAAGISSIYARYMDFTHRFLFTESSLEQVLRMAGFSRVRFLSQRLPWKWTPRHIAYRLMRFLYFHLMRVAFTLEQPGEHPPTHFELRIYAEGRLPE